MTLKDGQCVGPYRIDGKLGEGGMGAVYRAVDQRLDREVAIKILPDDVIQDSRRSDRFRREARILASLNHHGIASIYDLEDLDDRFCLVLELVPGRSLEEVLKDGPLELEKAGTLFAQAAEALHAAHQEQILHRDLKPGNIMLTPGGQVKLLDFGLAKAVGGELDEKVDMKTREGTVLGTANYLAPEQIVGGEFDARTDLWGMGCCLFEAVTGSQAFPGETIGETLGSVLTAEPDWSLLPPNSGLHSLLRECLQKEKQERPASAAIFRERLLLATSGRPEDRPKAPSRPPAGPPAKASTMGAGKALLLVLPALILAFILGWSLSPEGRQDSPSRFLSLTLGEGKSLPSAHPAPALSPDGLVLVFPALKDDSRRLYARRLDQELARPLAGTLGGAFPFFSPDGKKVGFLGESTLCWVPLEGGPTTRVAQGLSADQFLGAAWLDDDTIVFATTGGGLQSVSPGGTGLATLLAPDPEAGLAVVGWPVASGDSKRVIYSVRSGGTYADGTVESMNLATGERKTLKQQAYAARTAPSGELLYVRRGSLMLGDRVLLEKIWTEESRGEAAYATGPGILVTVSPRQSEAPSPHWVSREGTELETTGLPRTDLRVSPDARWIAFRKFQEQGRELWIQDANSGLERRLTGGANSAGFAFSADSRRLVFGWDQEGPFNIYETALGGAGSPKRLTRSPNRQFPKAWSHGHIIYEEEREGKEHDIFALPTNGEPFALADSQFDEREPALSPDGKWLSYQSDASGQTEIYLKPFPHGEPRVLAPGSEPVWTAQNHLLFRRENSIMEIADLESPREKPLFTRPFIDTTRRYWDVTPQGDRFLIVEETSHPIHDEIQVVLHLPGL